MKYSIETYCWIINQTNIRSNWQKWPSTLLRVALVKSPFTHMGNSFLTLSDEETMLYLYVYIYIYIFYIYIYIYSCFGQ